MQYIKPIASESQYLIFSNPTDGVSTLVFTSYSGSFEVTITDGWFNSLFTTVEYSLSATQAAMVKPGITWKVQFGGSSDYCQSVTPESVVIEYQPEI